LNVLSLCDGISGGQVALERAGIKVDKYYASEIEPKAIKVTQKHYPNTIQLGNVEKVNYKDGVLYTENGDFQVGNIDMLIAGTPCQDLSAYKKNKYDAKGLAGSKSKLFYHYERLLKEVNPTYFFLENVVMDQEWQDIITEILGVPSILIDSNLVSAADRKRLYWTNIPNVTQPEDRGVVIKDIIVPASQVPDKYWYDWDFVYNGDDKKVQCTILKDKGLQRNMKEVYNQKFKCNTLLADGDGGNRQKKVYQDGRVRKFMPIEYERMMNLPDNYTDCISDSARYSAVGNGWTVDVIAHIFSGIK
jgi:site-specific DNA-cytosine methylase